MQKFSRRDHLRKIEQTLQAEWKDKKIFEAKPDFNWEKTYISKEEKNKNKFMVTFPYPYMNGRLHLGHGFSLSKCEFVSRYQRLIGKNVLFPFAFHCTGMPIAAAANRVKAELSKFNGNIDEVLKDSKSQMSILRQCGVEKELLEKFANPVFWLEYFPDFSKRDLEELGVNADFSRSFITTTRQAYYDKFIQWQFNTLRKNGALKFGKRYTVFSKSDDQPCADHDRSEGEGVGVQEYTAIKLELLPSDGLRSDLKEFIQKEKVYLVAATLRPETMYGQTNLFVLPTGEYGLFQMKNGEYIICSQNSADNMSYQELMIEEKRAKAIKILKGSDLVGAKLRAPLTSLEEIYVLPLLTISMTKGTGLVTSVPSDAPDDYIAIRDLQQDEKLRSKYNVKEEYIRDIKPISIVNVPEIGSLSAVDLCEKLGVKNQHDTEKLKKIKEEVYTKGFYTGTMLVGKYKGEKIEVAKVKVKNDLIGENKAFSYYEPESLVKTRTGEICIVALVDQWMISYGEDSHRELLHKHLTTNWKSYSSVTFKELVSKIDWLKEWGCSRIFGLGSYIPWDKQYLIESLSDSTIYMAYYTISKYFHKDIYGDVPNLIKPEQVNDSLFDYVFLGQKDDEALSKLGIEESILLQMRQEFEFWYPMDLRCSGKDLIGNHLTMSLYNHSFIWNKDPYYLPRSIFTNGHILLNGKVMSKKTGNFLTISDIISQYGADASRLTLADCGDGNDDANFLTDLANSSVNRLYTFENFIKALYSQCNYQETKVIQESSNRDLNKFDLIFQNNLYYLIEQTQLAYDSMKFKDVLKFGFYEMINIRDQYIIYNESDYTRLNHNLMLKFFKYFFIINNPIIPHWTEYMYKTYLNPIYEKLGRKEETVESLALARYPVITESIDAKMFAYNKYLKGVISQIHDIIASKQTDNKKPKKGEKPKEEEQENETKKKPQQVFTKKSKFSKYSFHFVLI